MFPSGRGSVRAWALCSTFLSLPLSLQEDGLPCGPVLQRKVTYGSTEVFRFGVSHHGSGVAQEEEERVESGEMERRTGSLLHRFNFYCQQQNFWPQPIKFYRKVQHSSYWT